MSETAPTAKDWLSINFVQYCSGSLLAQTRLTHMYVSDSGISFVTACCQAWQRVAQQTEDARWLYCLRCARQLPLARGEEADSWHWDITWDKFAPRLESVMAQLCDPLESLLAVQQLERELEDLRPVAQRQLEDHVAKVARAGRSK